MAHSTENAHNFNFIVVILSRGLINVEKRKFVEFLLTACNKILINFKVDAEGIKGYVYSSLIQ